MNRKLLTLAATILLCPGLAAADPWSNHGRESSPPTSRVSAPSAHIQSAPPMRYTPPVMHYQPPTGMHYQPSYHPSYQAPAPHYTYGYGGRSGATFQGSTQSPPPIMHPGVFSHYVPPPQTPVAVVRKGVLEYAHHQPINVPSVATSGWQHHHRWNGQVGYSPYYSSSYYYGPYGGAGLYGDYVDTGDDTTPYAFNYDGITPPETPPDATGQMAPPAARPDAYHVIGVVVSIDDQQMTVQAANGGYTFALTASTTATQVINVGDQVDVTFSVADDGSYQAAEITRAASR
ncbi:MAG TPA: DUF5666 domain-containing protein [Candidatus Xenobia bacterium]|jgi:hypothetical protein